MTRPQLWVIAGPNGAGKSTIATNRMAGKIPIVDPDAIAGMLVARGAIGRVELLAGRIAAQQRQRHLQDRRSFAIETTLTGSSALRLMALAKAADYKINLIYVGLDDVALSHARVGLRVRAGGHAVPAADIERRYRSSLDNLPKAIALAERTFVLDNSGSWRRRVARLDKDRITYRAAQIPAWSSAAMTAFSSSGAVTALRPGLRPRR